jgi:hypothetical protein
MDTKKVEELTCVTSAEVTHIITTAPIRNNPALYLQLITNQTGQNPDTELQKRSKVMVLSDLRTCV